MAWPTGSDYQTAVQNPKTAFKDTELQDCSVQPGAMGLPWVASGSFASVFCLIHPNRQKFAARTFNRQVTVQKDRYKAISDHLGGIVFPFMVAFEYQEQGIQIAGQWYPLIKMGWVDGVQFGKAVEDNISNPDILRYMAAQLRGINSGLEGNHMSHCDLQHGNIMVNANGDLILVDYDDCFVPSLAGEQAIALGMPNYQHPKRSASDFNEHIDHFSALVIYMSLGALAADQSLFQKYNGDNLILKENDYKDVNAKVWLDLAHSSEKVVVEMTDIIRQACKDPITKVPSLEDVLKQTGVLPTGKRPVAQTIQPVAPRPVVTQVSTPLTQQPTPLPQQRIPQITISTTRLDFGELLVSANEQLDFEIQNPGTGDLQINSVSCADPAINILGVQNLVPANGGKSKITAVYQPTQVGDLNTVVEIDSNAGKKQIVLVGKVTNKAITGISPSPLYVGDMKEILIHGFGFEKRVVARQLVMGRGRNQQTQNVLDEFLPSVVSPAPGITINNIQYVSPTALRGFIEIPKSCAGTYDIVVTNPVDPTNPMLVQIFGKNKLEIQDLPSGQIKCKKCGVLMDEPDPNDWDSWKCPSCHWHQGKTIYT